MTVNTDAGHRVQTAVLAHLGKAVDNDRAEVTYGKTRAKNVDRYTEATLELKSEESVLPQLVYRIANTASLAVVIVLGISERALKFPNIVGLISCDKMGASALYVHCYFICLKVISEVALSFYHVVFPLFFS